MSRQRIRPRCGISPTRIRDNIDELLNYCQVVSDDNDDERLRLKAAIGSLGDEDMRTLSYYAELGSYRKMAALLGASPTTWRREVNRIRELIKVKL